MQDPQDSFRRRLRLPRLAAVAGTLLLIGATTDLLRAQDCERRTRLAVSIAIDISDSMVYTRAPDGRWTRGDPWKQAAAGAISTGLLGGFERLGVLGAAGAWSIPTGFESAPVSSDPERIAEVEYFLTFTGDADSTYRQDLYRAIAQASDDLAGFAGVDRKVLVVLAHRGNSGPGLESLAIDALLRSDASVYLIYVGDPAVSDDPGPVGNAYLALHRLADLTGGRLRIVARGDSTAARVDEILHEEACANYRPTASLTLRPPALRLGTDGFTIVFDASGSRDTETAPAGLEYRWTFRAPDGTVESMTSGRGEAAAVVTRTFTDDLLPGTSWAVTVQVFDAAGVAASASQPFEVTGSPPAIEFEGGGAIDVLEEMRLGTARAEDVDGGPLTFAWELVSAPPGGHHPAGARWETQRIPPFVTTEADITLRSPACRPPDECRLHDPWRFSLRVTDDEGVAESGLIDVEVRNLAPPAVITGPSRVRVGETITLSAGGTEDPDGGATTLAWDIIQAPDADADSATRAPGYGVSSDASFRLATAARDAGTWIFRLTVRDNEGESASADQVVLVDALPVAVVSADSGAEPIGSLTDPLAIDSSASSDPDTPCAAPDYCHTNLDGEVRGISGGIRRRSWRLVDSPIEWAGTFPLGGVDEVLGVPGHGARLEIGPATLRPGAWTFQLQVEDAEANRDEARLQVEVFDEAVRPIAVVTPPRRETLDRLNRPAGAVGVSGAASYDPDDRARGGGPGIERFAWDLVSAPDCATVTVPTDPAASEFPLFNAAAPIPPACHGAWHLRLTVEDAEGQEGSAETSVVVSNCPNPVCLDYPTAATPVIVEPGAEIDVPIYYHLDSALYGGATFAAGLYARVDIYDSLDPGTIVFTSFDANVVPTPVGPSLAFHWTGHRDRHGPRPGLYTVRVSLLDGGLGDPIHSAVEERAIAIAAGSWIENCGNLWAAGFPDRRDGGSFPCVEYRDESLTPPFDLRLFYPPGWDTFPIVQEILRWTDTALRTSVTTLGALGEIPPIVAVISDREPPDPNNEFDLAITFSHRTGPGEPCPIVIYPRSLDYEQRDYMQIVAHEVAHCFQSTRWTWADGDQWWIEGSAEFLSNLVYPDTNFEHGRIGNFSPAMPLYEQIAESAYANAVFYQYLANRPGVGLPGLLDLLGRLSSAGDAAHPRGVLAALPDAQGLLHEFAQQLHDGRVRDEGSAPDAPFWPRYSWASVGGVEVAGAVIDVGGLPGGALQATTGGFTLEPRPFAIGLTYIYFGPGHRYTLRVTTEGAPGRSSAFRDLPVTTPVWGGLPATVSPGCREGQSWPVLVTSASASGTHRLRVTFTSTPDPACAP